MLDFSQLPPPDDPRLANGSFLVVPGERACILLTTAPWVPSEVGRRLGVGGAVLGGPDGLLTDGFFQGGGLVGGFPGQIGIGFAEVAVVGGFEVDWPQQVELADDVGWFEGEDLLNGGEDGGKGSGTAPSI